MSRSRRKRGRRRDRPAAIALLLLALGTIATGFFNTLGNNVLERAKTLLRHEGSPLTATLMSWPDISVSRDAAFVAAYYTTRELAALTPPPMSGLDDRRWKAWARTNAAIPANKVRIYVELSTSRDSPVTVRRFRPVVIRRPARPVGGTIVEQRGAGPVPYAYFSVDLDSSPSLVSPGKPDEWSPAGFEGSLPYTINREGPAILVIDAWTNQGAEWKLLMDWEFEGELRTTELNDGNTPFFVVSPIGARTVFALKGKFITK